MFSTTIGDLTVALYDTANEPESLPVSRPWNVERLECVAHDYVGGVGADAWLGAPSTDEFNRRLLEGWGEGVDKLRELAIRDIELHSIRRRRIRSDQGDEVDMQAVWRGDLSRAWARTRRQSRAGGVRSVTLVCNLACSWKQKAADLFWRGASALRLTEELSAAGYNVAVFAATGTTDFANKSKKRLAQFVEIKASDGPLDMSALASMVGMPGYKRRMFHRGTIAAADALSKDVDGGLGRPSSDVIKQGAEQIPGLSNPFLQPYSVLSKESAEAWIESVLTELQA